MALQAWAWRETAIQWSGRREKGGDSEEPPVVVRTTHRCLGVLRSSSGSTILSPIVSTANASSKRRRCSSTSADGGARGASVAACGANVSLLRWGRTTRWRWRRAAPQTVTHAAERAWMLRGEGALLRCSKVTSPASSIGVVTGGRKQKLCCCKHRCRWADGLCGRSLLVAR